MTKNLNFFTGVLLACTLLIAAPGCEETPAEATGGAGGSGGEAGSGGSGGSGGNMATLPTCAKYCADITMNCTAANAQYASPASCLGACAAFPVGTFADMAGDTLGCRQYHTGAAAADAAAALVHCGHAGPAGSGACGAICDGFCDIATKACATEWPTMAACKTACMGWTATGGAYNTSDTNKNTTECRMYHLSVAATDAASATMHCPHTVTSSPTCTM